MKIQTLGLGIIALFLITACGPSPDEVQATAHAIITAAAETANAQRTENALLTPSPTNTPTPSETPTATNTSDATLAATPTKGSGGSLGSVAGGGCDVMGFVADVTIPDGSEITAGSTFDKTWRLKNIGSCTWTTSYNIVFNNSNQLGGPTTKALPVSVEPGATVDITLQLTAPTTNGNYSGAWTLRNTAGENFGYFYVIINSVGQSGSASATSGTTTTTATTTPSTATSTPTATPTP